MVPKTDGTWRPCGDFRRLNLVTVPDAYPLPNMQDFSVKAADSVIFSKIDLRKGYHQVAVNAADVPKTAISTPFGMFEYLRMPFGLRNSGNTFQRHMDRVVAGLNGVFAYLDDVLVSSADKVQHAADLRQLFCRLLRAALRGNSLWPLWRSGGAQIDAGRVPPDYGHFHHFNWFVARL
jgi:cytoskeleton-associated protein 5